MVSRALFSVVVISSCFAFGSQSVAQDGSAAPRPNEQSLQEWPRAEGEGPIIYRDINLQHLMDLPQSQKSLGEKSTCATWNYSDIGLPCLRAYGRQSSCVWASGWGWVYFNNYSTVCATTLLTVCYSSYGSCG